MSRKSLLYGTAALATVVIILATPRAAHALAATLVQVTNTAANPAIAQSPNTQAAQLVELASNAFFNNNVTVFSPFQSTQSITNYVVPAGQSLVITSLDIDALTVSNSITPCATAGEIVLIRYGGVGNFIIYIPAFAPHAHYEFPSGIVFAAGVQPQLSYGDLTDNKPSCNAGVYAHGYLTAN